MKAYRRKMFTSRRGVATTIIPDSTTTPSYVAVSRTTEDAGTRYLAGFITAETSYSTTYRYWAEFTPDDLREMFVVWSRDPQFRKIMRDALAERADDAAPLEMSVPA